MEVRPKFLGVVEITSSMQTRIRCSVLLERSLEKSLEKSEVPTSCLAFIGDCIEDLGRRNSCFGLFNETGMLGKPSPANTVGFSYRFCQI
jgi:hypothetical protein